MTHTAASITRLKFNGKDQRIRVAENLYINLTKNRKVWLYRSRVNGVALAKTLGQYEDMTFRQAKDAAYALRTAKPEPIKHSFSELAADYLSESKHAQMDALQGRITILVNFFGHRDINTLSRLDVVNFIRGYRKQSTSMADQLLIRIRAVLGHGVSLGWLDENPAAGIPRSTSGYTPRPRTRILSDDEIRMLFSQGNSNARVIRFILLTGLRISEALKGELVSDKYHVVAKGGREHWVHLTDLAREQLPFPTGRGSTVVNDWLRRHQKSEDRYTSHAARKTFSTIANECGIAPHIVEKVLNHKLQGMMGVYNFAQYEQERIECSRVVEAYVLKVVNALPDWLS